MDKIDYYQQLLDIVLDEVNVKEMKFNLPVVTEKGDVSLIYNGTYFYWLLDKEAYPVKSEENVIKTLDHYFDRKK